VNTADEEIGRLVLNGVDISSLRARTILRQKRRRSGDRPRREYGESSIRRKTRVFSKIRGEDEPNAAIFSMADLTIDGYGSLTVDGNYSDG